MKKNPQNNKQNRKQRDTYTSGKVSANVKASSRGKSYASEKSSASGWKNSAKREFYQQIYKPDASLVNHVPLFEAASISKDAKAVLDTFDKVVQSVKPLSAKQLHLLPNIIRDLSHSLTDERGTRRVGYMNDAQQLSAYTRYFSWWNLVRLTRLFANLPKDAFGLDDGDVCLDIGSGPLTVVCALWLARPELREKKLTWYCMDISKSTLALGEDLYLSIVARTSASASAGEKAVAGEGASANGGSFADDTFVSENDSASDIAHWQIIRVTGALGAATIKQKASFITCANMFNELYQDTNEPPEFSAKKYSEALLSYSTDDARVLVVEPGIPKTARFISLLRDSFIRKNMQIISPCPHANECPMNGARAHRGGSAKWCNFSFNTEERGSVPVALQKLSEAAKLGKYRAVMSFVFATRASVAASTAAGEQNSRIANASSPSRNAPSESIFRIASEPIKLFHGEVGFYACGEEGLVLIINKTQKAFASGDLISVAINSLKKHSVPSKKISPHGHSPRGELIRENNDRNFQIDKKSGARIIVVGD